MNGTFMKPRLSFGNLASHRVFHGITTRNWGSLNPFVGYEGLGRLEAGVALEDGSPGREHIVYAEQVHEANVHRCVGSDSGSIRLQADGLVGAEPSLILAAYAADCIPLLLYHPKTGAAGALHAGQQPLPAGIVGAGIGAM